MPGNKSTMKRIRLVLIIAVLLTPLICVIGPAVMMIIPFAGSYDIDAVQFTLTDPSSIPEEPAPKIWIDTNLDLSLYGGTLTTSKPYGIAFDYTDNTFTLSEVEFTKVKIIYDDGTVELATDALGLPRRVKFQEQEFTNSVSGGRIVKTNVRLVSGKLPDVITRDESFTLQIDGHFTSEDGSTLPFKLDQHYDVQREKGTKAGSEVLRDG